MNKIMRPILIVSKDPQAFGFMQTCFPLERVLEKADSKNTAIELLQKGRYDFIFIDLALLRDPLLPADSYKTGLQSFWHLDPAMEIIVMASQEMIREAVKAVKAGASDYITLPLNQDEIRQVLESARDTSQLQAEADFLKDLFSETSALGIVQTKNNLMKIVFDKIRSVAPTKSTVLLMGETGTGKGVMANLIHRHSNRRDAQFISVHCGAIPDTLLESELFGHEKGAFTGAVRRKLGKFELAQNGTIFLDEIGTITPSAQIKLLQVLQEGALQRVGGEENIQANVRVIAATNTDLKKMCDEGLFRKDLYYRLHVFPIELPPLRERLEDIPYFIEMFLDRMNKTYAKDIQGVHPRVLEAFYQYLWPGNIREMENLMERAYILETSALLTPESFPGELLESETLSTHITVDADLTLAEVRSKGVEEIERNYLKEQLTQNKGIIQNTARAAGITTRQLHKLMQKHGIRKEDFKAVNR